MEICHQHNLPGLANSAAKRAFGIRVTIPASDPLQKLIGADWEKYHWFSTEAERDTVYENMHKRHGFYRVGDNPSQILEKVRR